MKRICVFCGASPGARSEYMDAAQALGKELASREITLVYGGGDVGMMGGVARAVMDHGGQVIGVIPTLFVDQGLALNSVSEIKEVGSMHERKMVMAELSDAFIALPGGLGTFEEILEALTWTQIGIHQKACGFLNVQGYYDLLLAFFDTAVEEGFIHPANRKMINVGEDPAYLLDELAGSQSPRVDKVAWIKEFGK